MNHINYIRISSLLVVASIIPRNKEGEKKAINDYLMIFQAAGFEENCKPKILESVPR